MQVPITGDKIPDDIIERMKEVGAEYDPSELQNKVGIVFSGPVDSGKQTSCKSQAGFCPSDQATLFIS